MTKLLELEKQQNKILDLFDLLHLTKDSDMLKENDNTNS